MPRLRTGELTSIARQVSSFVKEFEAYVKLLGGHIMYLDSSRQWCVTIPRTETSHGAVQIRIDEGTPLEEATKMLADAYDKVHGYTVPSTGDQNG